MAASIRSTLTRSLGPPIIARASTVYGESESAVRKGLTTAIAAVLAPLSGRSSELHFTRDLVALLKETPSDVALLDDPERAFSRPIPMPGDAGPFARLTSLLFGGSTRNVTDAIAAAAGVKTTTASSLFGLAVPTVLGYLSRLVKQENFDAASLGRRLTAERATLSDVLPSTLAPLLAGGTSVVGDVGRAGAAGGAEGRETDNRAAAAVAEPRPSPGTWVALALGGLIALAALYALMGRPGRGLDGTPGAIGTAGYLSRTLPDGTTLRFPPASTEARLLVFIESDAPLDRDTWYEFDRVTFETDSATLRAESREQLSNVAAILNAYPAARVKIGGYTDNSGDRAANQRLSQARAERVMSELRAMGVARSRLEAEGYGDQHPLVDNATAEGRAENRRVALRVTSR